MPTFSHRLGLYKNDGLANVRHMNVHTMDSCMEDLIETLNVFDLSLTVTTNLITINVLNLPGQKA